MITPVRSAQWRSLLARLLVFLVPSFLQGPKAREMIRPAKLSPTAYLDGVRGLAALFVFFCHYSYQAFRIAFSWGCEDDNWSWLKLPILRLWYQGPMAVSIFYVISGYALSYRAMKLARARSWPDFWNSVSSLVFRRGIRLYLPTAISTLIIVFLLRIGAYDWNRDFANDKTYMKNVVEPHPLRMDSSYDQLVDWLKHLFDFIHVYDWERYKTTASYDVHLWTIPTEFRCSLYLFIAIVGTARLKTWARFLTIISATLFTFGNSRWDMLLFFCGMMLAEYDHIRGAHLAPPLPLPPPATSTSDHYYSSSSSSSSDDEYDEDAQLEKPSAATALDPRRRNLMPYVWGALSVVALYLLSFPDDKGDITPGWRLLTAAIPSWWAATRFRYWQSIGAVLFLFVVGHSPRWQRLFETAPVQYLGKISYALYIMHGPVMHTLGYSWERLAYAITGTEGYWFNAGFTLGACFAVPTVVWVADIFWRAVDMPSVRFAKWLENKWLAKD
ncbi:hypothetical protein ESCO_006256 [Escovopsis weberi]|uniref:Acyltransferase 3 domain-containing protein n=1 Tax=Escovopsis weberi TaxID=150374 RepID=A0A0M9VUV1_ESCWE|nr:hypothetical protein ESCO_006256 [Escovopsis weberi]